MTVRRTLRSLGRAVVAVAVVGAVVASGIALRQRGEAVDARDAAAAETVAERRAAAGLTDRLSRIEAWIGDNQAIARRDLAAAVRTDTGIAELEDLHARLEQAEADLVGLRTLSEEQVRQIDILRPCVRTLDAVRSALAGGDTSRATVLLEDGREGCRRAESLADGIDAAAHPYDFPDPHVLTVDGTYYAYGTNGPAGTVQVVVSDDLVDWRIGGSALTAVPGWARPGFTWAPAAVRTLGGYVLYYTVRHAETGKQCISVATSASPTGPFVDGSSGPLICQLGEGGSIDPSPYQDEDGVLFLTWKSEGETVGGRSQLWAQPLDATGTKLEWFPTPLLRTEREWEGRVIEAPSMALLGGQWVLLYSGGAWNTSGYAIGYARCQGPLGPCSRPEGDNVLLRSSRVVVGPGGAEVFRTPAGEAKVAYAGWDPGGVGPPNPRRLHLATLVASDGTLTLR